MPNRLIIDFFSPTCAPCKTLDLYLKKFEDLIEIKRVDVTVNTEMAKEYGVTGLPTVAFVEDGHVVNTIHGFSFRLVAAIGDFAGTT